MSVCCECCVLSGRGLCDEVITRPEESYWLWCVVVCDLETSWIGRSWPTGGCCAKESLGAPIRVVASIFVRNFSGRQHAFCRLTCKKKAADAPVCCAAFLFTLSLLIFFLPHRQTIVVCRNVPLIIWYLMGG